MSRKQKHSQSNKKAQLDIVITTAGRFDVLEKCLESVYQESHLVPVNVYIVDNASNPEERIQHQNLFTQDDEYDGVVRFQTKRLTQNSGFPGAANEGARMGNAPIVMFLSDDVELSPGTLEKILKNFDDKSIGIVGIKLLFPLDSTDKNRPAGKVQHIGLALNIRADPFHPLIGWSPDNPKTCERNKSTVWDAWAVTGACFTIRRELFNKVRGFDPIFGKGTYEDADLCLKVRQLGFRIICDSSAVGYHHVGATAMKRNEPFPLQQNNMIFKSRWANTQFFSWDEFLYW